MFLGTQRRFGVEIEFTRANVNRDALARAITDAGVQCAAEGYNHATRSYWKIVTDASCGLEMVSPILQGENGFQQLKTVLDTMAEMGCTVNRSTGVHVHLEAADLTALDVKNIVTRYADNEAEIDTWFPRSRRASNNQYCSPVSQGIDVSFRNVDEGALDAERATSAQSYMRHRFCKVNLASLSRYNTIEFRQHAGTTDFNKVSNWVMFLQHFVEQSRKVKAASGPSIRYWATGGTKAFAELREQIEAAGGYMKSAGNGSWKIGNGHGGEIVKTNDQIFRVYKPETRRSTGVTIRPRGRFRRAQFEPFVRDELAQIWVEIFGGTESGVPDASLNAAIPTSVVYFFNHRRDLLAA